MLTDCSRSRTNELNLRDAAMVGSTKIIFCSLFFCFNTIGISQSEPDDINIYSQAPICLSAEDSMMFPIDMYKSIMVEFDLSDSANLGKLHIELAMNDYNTIVSKYNLSLTDLLQNSLITGNHVSLGFGNQQTEAVYLISITIETTSGALQPTITKVLSL